MRLLLDTNVLIWSTTNPDELEKDAREMIESGANDVFVSIVSAWEIAIKQSIGKLYLVEPAERWLPDVLRRTGFAIAELNLAAALRVRSLPWHHRDPFDRFLVAQALEHGYTLVTRDAQLRAYGVPVLTA